MTDTTTITSLCLSKQNERYFWTVWLHGEIVGEYAGDEFEAAKAHYDSIVNTVILASAIGTIKTGAVITA